MKTVNWCAAQKFVVAMMLTSLATGSVDAAEDTFSIREFVSIKDKWPTFARTSTQLTLNGRFAGSIARQFRLHQLPFMVTPERTTALPSDVDAGERITIIGTLGKTGSRYQFYASRIAIGAKDSIRLKRQIQDLPDGHFADAYLLADRYEQIAQFYKDDILTIQIQSLRSSTFAKQRKAAAKDFQQLQRLLISAKKLGLSEDIQQHVLFQSVYQMSKQKGVLAVDVLKQIRSRLPGWDVSEKSLTAEQQLAFQKDAIATYEGLIDQQRPVFHRFLYRTVRLPQLLKQLKADGSNGNEVATKITQELPEEIDSIKQANEKYVDFRLVAVPKLTRRQLSELEELLVSLKRPADFDQALNHWLTAQEKRLNNQQLDGLLETADQFLFAFERWKKKQHGDTGVKYMKRAWQLASGAAPEEAATIETRMEQLGWVRLRDDWMTTAEVDALPDSDMDLAVKEGRVVEGMSVAQVELILGGPERRIRVASKGKVQEVWIFGGGEASGITVHLSRRSFEVPASAVVTKVARTRR
ncbi:MAG: hypothetical protein ABJZ55_09490 [Fuerstiella sp.]